MGMENASNGYRVEISPQNGLNETLQQAGVYLRTMQDRQVETYGLFDSAVWTPGKARSREFANAYPISAMFVGIFTALAFIPVASYLIFTAFVLISTVSLALATAIGFTLFVGLFLFGTLIIILLFASAATLGLLGCFLAIRLLFHIRSQEGQGVQGWVAETKDRIVPPSAQQYVRDAQTKVNEYYDAAKDRSVKPEQM
ncbi:SubName: Full=Uncharacterized protein {ECO:0000313/EMBL:CCA70890.1} [Serendipita indica DSM 11827]|uniref:Uncharacterized protein n=1 Tax=Serendipita indica (strain DSM 11827) TaxID=1109443 RepID=G4THU1_SERID|nr:SubName: Full=Uncharacterized protein {ECO:0000313/EMBL:CCA70890.1} [Serendipita indica DSM 11827]CCA70890.1 hypothetical protein PIIN_04826 [Serendipita indica DSM 11827]